MVKSTLHVRTPVFLDSLRILNFHSWVSTALELETHVYCLRMTRFHHRLRFKTSSYGERYRLLLQEKSGLRACY